MLITVSCVLAELKALGQAELTSHGRTNSAPNQEELNSKTSYYQSKYPNIPAHR